MHYKFSNIIPDISSSLLLLSTFMILQITDPIGMATVSFELSLAPRESCLECVQYFSCIIGPSKVFLGYRYNDYWWNYCIYYLCFSLMHSWALDSSTIWHYIPFLPFEVRCESGIYKYDALTTSGGLQYASSLFGHQLPTVYCKASTGVVNNACILCRMLHYPYLFHKIWSGFQ